MKKKAFLSAFIILTNLAIAISQVNAYQLDQIASHLLTVNGIQLQGSIIVNSYQARGFAATTSNGNYSVIYVDPNRMRTISANDWAFIIGHELAHLYLGHTWQSPQNELDADRYGAYWAYKAGYNVNAYLSFMATEPDVCTASHGCWQNRIRNIMNMFGQSYNGYCE
jgi:hypothetical protein